VVTLSPHHSPLISHWAACRTLPTTQSLINGLPRAHGISLDVLSPKDLDPQVAAHDLVISLVPYTYHPVVIKSAIKGRTNVVTTSYVAPAMRELDAAAKEAGIVVLNEVGVDPGVDHLYAIKTIDEVHAKGGKVKEFYSYCGGLPALDCADNPLKFKFSWSPRGALLAQNNSAIFLYKGEQVEIPGRDLMAFSKPYFIKDGYSFVAYPNRNSVPFREFYNIPEADTIIRGTLRYDGNPSFYQALVKLGWLDTEGKDWLKDGLTWADIQQRAIGADSADESSLISRIEEVCKFPTKAERDRIISGLRWIGILSPQRAAVRENLLDTLCAQLEKLMSFQPEERDLVMLQHKFVVEWSDGKTVCHSIVVDLRLSMLIVYPGYLNVHA
jgi:saccharopine dehydrogenase-like NADP-dependent oxidoreductase